MSSKILVTGAAGLLGKRVIRELLLKDFEVFTLTRKPYPVKGSQNIIIDLSGQWEFSKLPPQIDVVIHLAQSNHYKDFPSHASDIFNVNMSSSVRLLEYARTANAKLFIYTSTGGVYGNSNKPFHEFQATQLTLPNNFYFSTKWCTETLIYNYNKFFNTVIFRPFFIYGKGQDRSMLIPRIFDKVASYNPIDISGNDGIKINPIHVNDAANALVLSLNLKKSRTYNLAGPEVLSIREISEIFGKYLGAIPKFNHSNDNSEDIVGDISLLTKDLYRPQIKLSEKVFELI